MHNPMFLSRARIVGSAFCVGEFVSKGGALPRFGAILYLVCLLFCLVVPSAFCADQTLSGAGESHSEKSPAIAARLLTVDETDELRGQKPVVVLDLRKRSDFFRGHIPGAINVDYTDKDFGENLAALDKHHTYIIHSSTDPRSEDAAQKLAKLQFENVFTLRGGFEAWQDAGKPVEKRAAPPEPKN